MAVKILDLPHGIPSYDTFGRIFEKIIPNEFQNSFMHWIESVAELTKGQVVAIDGKTLRRSHDWWYAQAESLWSGPGV